MAKYYIRVIHNRDKTKKSQAIAGLLQRYNATIVCSDRAMQAIVRNIEEFVNEYNEIYKDKTTYVTIKENNDDIMAKICTEGSDIASILWFYHVDWELKLTND